MNYKKVISDECLKYLDNIVNPTAEDIANLSKQLNIDHVVLSEYFVKRESKKTNRKDDLK